MELLKSDPSAIPLKCTLCPKRPNFSDVSHLLTHISSKSHLSHRFKTELKALSEPECQERVRVYEEWYERHGIRALLAERMSTKDQKPAAKRGRPAQTQVSLWVCSPALRPAGKTGRKLIVNRRQHKPKAALPPSATTRSRSRPRTRIRPPPHILTIGQQILRLCFPSEAPTAPQIQSTLIEQTATAPP